jgi:hypothetical protein
MTGGDARMGRVARNERSSAAVNHLKAHPKAQIGALPAHAPGPPAEGQRHAAIHPDHPLPVGVQ